jgi:ABC-type Fe3+ transport system substrate-binding protein
MLTALALAKQTLCDVMRRVPKRYEHLASPKWKDKMTMDKQDVDLYTTWLKLMGREFLEEITHGRWPMQRITLVNRFSRSDSCR